METEELKDSVSDLVNHLGDYAETFVRLATVNIAQKAANIASATLSATLLCVLSLFVLFFMSLGLSWWLGDIFSNRVLGFITTGGFYLLILVCTILLNKKVVLPYLRNLMVNKMYE